MCGEIPGRWSLGWSLWALGVQEADSTGQLSAKVDKGELLLANGDVQMNYAQSESMPNLGIYFPDNTTLSLPYSVGLVAEAPHEANAKEFLDYLFSTEVQEMTTTVAGGFPARSDVKPTGEKADDLFALMKGVKVLHPDWAEIAADLDDILADYNSATGTL